jgi:hypothetical protein
MPPDLIERMMAVLFEAIQTILAAYYGDLDKAFKGPICKQEPPYEDSCRCVMLGSLVSFLLARGLCPQPKPAVNITGLMCTGLEQLVRRPHRPHTYWTRVQGHREACANSEGKIMELVSLAAANEEELIGHWVTTHKTTSILRI